jgi:hypothetical protein
MDLSGQLKTSLAEAESAAQDVLRPLASVAFVGSQIGDSVSPGLPKMGQFFFTLYGSDYRSNQTAALRWEQWGNFRESEPSREVRRLKRPTHEGLTALRRMREESVARDRQVQERDWLASHRKEYVGEWIALLGDQLIAHSADAREVFQAVRGATEKPLVLRVEDSALPFAGW